MCEVLSKVNANLSPARQLATLSPASTGNASPEVAACCDLATCPATPAHDLMAHHSNNRAGQAGPDNQATASTHPQQQRSAALMTTAEPHSEQQMSAACALSAVPDTVVDLPVAVMGPEVPVDLIQSTLAAQASASAARETPLTSAASRSAPAAVAAIAARAAAIGAATNGALPWTLQRKVFKLPPATLAPQAMPGANRAWKQYKTADGEVYHFNSVTKQRCWVLPQGAVVQPVQQQEREPPTALRLNEMAQTQKKSMELLMQQHIQQHEVQQQQQHQEQQTRWTVQQLQQLRRLAQLPPQQQQHQPEGTMQQHVAQHVNHSNSSDVLQVATPAASAAVEQPASAATATVSNVVAQPAAAAISSLSSGLLQPPLAAGTPNWVEGVNLKAAAEEFPDRAPSDDRSTLVFVPEAKAVNYLAKVANHFNAAAGTTACTAWLLYEAGIRVLRPKAGGNAYIWWASSRMRMSEAATADNPAPAALGATVPAAATTDAIKCRSAGMAALTLMKQHSDWRQLLGIDAPPPAAVDDTPAAQAAMQPSRAAAQDPAAATATASAAPAGALSITSSYSSEDGSSAETASETAAPTARPDVNKPQKEIPTHVNAGNCTGVISRKRRSSGDSTVTAESAGGHHRAHIKPCLDPAEAAAMAVPTPVAAPAPAPAAAAPAAPAAAAPAAAAPAPGQVAGVQTATPHDPMQVDASHAAQAAAVDVVQMGTSGNLKDRKASTPAAALEAAAGLLLYFSSRGNEDAVEGNPNAAAEAATQTSIPEQPSTNKPAVTAAAAAAPPAAVGTAQDLETPFATFCPVDGPTTKAVTSFGPVLQAIPHPSAALGVMPWAGVMSMMQQAPVAPIQTATHTSVPGQSLAVSAASGGAAAAYLGRGTGAETLAGVLGPHGRHQYQAATVAAVAAAQGHAQAAATAAAANNAASASPNTLQQVLAAARVVPDTGANALNAASQQYQVPAEFPAVAQLPMAATTGGGAGMTTAQLVSNLNQQRNVDVAQLLDNVVAVEKQLTEAISLASMFVSGPETASGSLAILSHLLNIGDRATQALLMSEAQQLSDNLAKGKQALQLLAMNPVFATAFGGVRDTLAQEVDTAAVWLTQRQSYVHQLRSAEATAQAMVKDLSQALERKGA